MGDLTFPHGLTQYINVCIIGGVRGGRIIIKEKNNKDKKTPKGKKCIWCLELKNYSEFNKYDKSTDGYRSQCNICINIKKRGNQ